MLDKRLTKGKKTKKIIKERNGFKVFKISYDKKMTMVQGDTGVIRMRIHNYELSQGDEVRFAIVNKANPSILLCQHSDKKIVLEKQVTVFEKDGSARIVIYPYDTEYLQPGKYLYEIQVKTKDSRVDTVVPLTSFTVMEGSIQGEYIPTLPGAGTNSYDIEVRFKRLENEIIPELGTRITNVENEIDSISSSLENINILHPPLPLLPCIPSDDLINPNFDNKSRLQAIMDIGRPVFIPNKTFLIQGYVSTSKCSMIYGEGTLKTTGNTPILIVTNPNVTIKDITLEGDLEKGKTNQKGIFIDDKKYYLTFNNIKFKNFGGYGLHIKRCQQETNTATINGCEFINNNTGIFLDERAEFCNITGNCKFRGNEISILIAGGNNSVIGNNINSTSTGIKLIGGANNSHGIISKNNINHCYDYGIYIDGITEGETIEGNNIYASNIYIKDTKIRAVRIINNTIDSNLQGEGNDKIELLGNKFVCSSSMSKTINFALNSKPSIVVGKDNIFDGANYNKFVNKIQGAYLRTNNSSNAKIETRKIADSNTYAIYNTDGTRCIITNLAYAPLLYNKETGVFSASGLSFGGLTNVHAEFVVLIPTSYENELPATFKILDSNNVYYTFSCIKTKFNDSYIKYTYSKDCVISLENDGTFKIICSDVGGSNFLSNSTLQKDETVIVCNNL